jgi:hypothetical protein
MVFEQLIKHSFGGSNDKNTLVRESFTYCMKSSSWVSPPHDYAKIDRRSVWIAINRLGFSSIFLSHQKALLTQAKQMLAFPHF